MKNIVINHKIMAALTVGVIMTQGGSASVAQTPAAKASLSSMTTKLTEATSELPNLISTIAYIAGIGLGVAGVFKLKAHVDNPAQNAMKDGLVRLGAGGGLLALPYLTKAMVGSIGESTEGVKLESGAFSMGTKTSG